MSTPALIEAAEAAIGEAGNALTEAQYVHGGTTPETIKVRVALAKAAAAVQSLRDGGAEPVARPSRDDDRRRFTDPAFNRWLDEGISDGGHTVWDAVGDVQAAWAGWDARPYYATPPTQGAQGVTKLAAFGAWAAREFRDSLADVDGGSAQDAMERFGVIVKRTVTEPCGEACVCAEYGPFPHDCYTFPADVAAVMDATPKEGSPT